MIGHFQARASLGICARRAPLGVLSKESYIAPVTVATEGWVATKTWVAAPRGRGLRQKWLDHPEEGVRRAGEVRGEVGGDHAGVDRVRRASRPAEPPDG